MSPWLDSVKDRLDPRVLELAAAETAEGRDPADFLLGGGHLSREDLLFFLSTHYDRPSLLLGEYEPEEEALARIPEDMARKFMVFPLFTERGRIFIATSDPDDLTVEDSIGQVTGLAMEAVVTTKGNILESINKHYLGSERSREKVRILAAPKAEAKPAEPPQTVQEIAIDDASPSIRFVDYMISTGIRLGASDIHLEPCEDSVLLRYRLDGILREYPGPAFDMIRSVVSRVKILAELDVSERRLPQDGRATFNVDGNNYDLRVSIIPNIYGESVVIRVLATSTEVKDLGEMGFPPDMLKQYTRMIAQPHGMVLVTGPTGSGKSTTLYATLKHILTPEKKILTLEDPVEARMRGVTQFQMNPGIGFTFARALRSVLRHDPEIVLLGEIRDQETAEIAIRASLTGHMIYSTLHTNDASSAPTRLMDMGVAGYLVMTSLLGVLAQRLVRRLCTKCRQPIEITEFHKEALGLERVPEGATPYKAVGCSECHNIGYKGRTAIYELLEINGEMRRLPASQITSEDIFLLAKKQNFATLRESGLEKWFAGVTSMEEIVKLTVD
jgi:type II secretory ATPase GspE/PulE/Tfp pilus assembly ATPase PilB-like protein